MNGTQRHILLRMLLPVAALALVYAAFIGMPKARELRLLEGDVQRAADAGQLKSRLSELQREEAALSRQITALTAQEAELSSAESQPAAAIDDKPAAGVVRDLSRLISRHHLTIIEDGLLDGSAMATMPAYLNPAAWRRAQADADAEFRGAARARPAGAQVWRVRFDGRYHDVTRMLESLARDSQAIPVSLNMAESAAGATRREWTLHIWLQ